MEEMKLRLRKNIIPWLRDQLSRPIMLACASSVSKPAGNATGTQPLARSRCATGCYRIDTRQDDIAGG